MARKSRRPRRTGEPLNSQPHVPPALDWEVSETWTHNGRRVVPGTEVSIRGERGRFRFVKHVRRASGVEWVDVIGGPAGATSFRSFRPSRIRTVHRLTKTRANSTRE